jgi:hypothetical protein
LRHFGQPASVVFQLSLDRVVHGVPTTQIPFSRDFTLSRVDAIGWMV